MRVRDAGSPDANTYSPCIAKRDANPIVPLSALLRAGRTERAVSWQSQRSFVDLGGSLSGSLSESHSIRSGTRLAWGPRI